MAEEARLRQNIEDQLERLLSQLADLDELKSELSDEEYQSEKKSTLPLAPAPCAASTLSV